MKPYIKNKELIKAFKDVKLNPQIKVGEWLNISTPDGINCEFYPNDKTNYAFTGTYSVNGKEKTLDFFMPYDLEEFVNTVCNILDHNPKKRK